MFGINDNETAEYVSTRLGEETVVLDSGGTSIGYTHQSGSGPHSQASTSSSRTSNRNWSLSARRLAKPEELMQLSPRTAITFAPGGMPPVCTTLLRWYEEKDFTKEPSAFGQAWSAIQTFVRSGMLCLFLIVVGAGVTASIVQEAHAQRQQVPSKVMNSNEHRVFRSSTVTSK